MMTQSPNDVVSGSGDLGVEQYLNELDHELLRLPLVRAGELRAQVREHLSEAIGRGADRGEIKRVLGHLGSPSDVVTEGLAVSPDQPTTGTSSDRRGFGRQLRPLVALLLALLLVLGAAQVIRSQIRDHVAALETTGRFMWLYPQDRDRARFVPGFDGGVLNQIPIRSGQRQGFIISVYNPSRFTQTILGSVPGWGQIGGWGFSAAVSSTAPNQAPARSLTNLVFRSQGVIPPHQSRFVRIDWLSTNCIEGAGSENETSFLLRVRRFGAVRSENLALTSGALSLLGPSLGRMRLALLPGVEGERGVCEGK
jgi:hypothetical protein